MSKQLQYVPILLQAPGSSERSYLAQNEPWMCKAWGWRGFCRRRRQIQLLSIIQGNRLFCFTAQAQGPKIADSVLPRKLDGNSASKDCEKRFIQMCYGFVVLVRCRNWECCSRCCISNNSSTAGSSNTSSPQDQSKLPRSLKMSCTASTCILNCHSFTMAVSI